MFYTQDVSRVTQSVFFILAEYVFLAYNETMSIMKKLVQIVLNEKDTGTAAGIRHIFSEFSKSMALIVDLDQLKDNVIANIREIINVENVSIFLLSEDLNRFVFAETRGVEPADTEQLYFDQEDPLIRWFAVNQTYLNVIERREVVNYFSKKEQEILSGLNVDLVFPLMAMNRLTGIVCLGRKRTFEKVSPDEIELLLLLLGQAAIAFENAYLYEQQKQRLKKMYRADRLATLGQLAAGAAHEIRNPLTSVRSTIQYLRKELSDSNKQQLVDDMIGEVDRINDIIEGMLSFSKPVKPEKEYVDIRVLLEQTLNLIATTARKMNVELQFGEKAEKTGTTADPDQLKQVFLNIIMNGIEACGDSGKLVVSLYIRTRTEPISSNVSRYVMAEFSDNGHGISPADIEHIFDPFYTTKSNGTGLGMSISYGIIQSHGGDIEIESRAGDEDEKGTTVRVWLPASV